MSAVVLRGLGMTPEEVLAVARDGAKVELASEAAQAMLVNRALVDEMDRSSEAVYGISTGFGALATTKIPSEKRVALQLGLIRSHAAGMGDAVEIEVVRALMVLRARTLAMGCSGIRPIVVERILDLLNNGITPVVREYGSLGASGDLAPLAHCALALIGEGRVVVDGVEMDASEAMAVAGLEPVDIQSKEGLSLTNGTDGMLGMLLMACHDIRQLLQTAEVVASMSIEALLGSSGPFVPALQAIRPHPGLARSAANMLKILEGSGIVSSHQEDCDRVQDAYSMRCAPQVTGGARDTLRFAEEVAGRELQSAIDNPAVLDAGRVMSNGNFHGAPVAYVLDFLAIVTTDVASISERRVDRLLDHTRSSGLPPFLGDDPGQDSGLMIAQYTAAGLVSDSKQLSAPASCDSVPTSGMQEDHVSMGWNAARQLRRVVLNAQRVIAVELVASARALDLRAPLVPSPATGAVVAAMRAAGMPGPGPDRVLEPELALATEFVASGQVVSVAEAVVGPLE